LLAVGLVAGGGVGWLLDRVRSGTAPLLSLRSLTAIIAFDLVLSLLIAVIAVLIGQAVVAYEIFTGKTLPRGGLARYWRNALLLAAAISLLIGVGVNLPLAPAYLLVALALLVTACYALFCWRAFVDREQGIARLRPFVGSQRLYDYALDVQPLPPNAVAAPFQALCDEALNARVAYLIPLGALAALAPPPLAYGAAAAPANLGELTPLLHAGPQQLFQPIDPGRYNGAGWAVPLWSERGLIGALLIGEKRDGGLYTQEQFETARAGAERLLDSEASAELARRLVALQRQRLAESQILDRRTRRVLHDDVLPKIHTALLQLADGKLQSELAEVHHDISNLLRALPPTAEPELVKLGLAGALRQLIDGELRGSFDQIQWQIAPEAASAAAQLTPLNAEVVFYAARELLRNAARHARGGDPARRLALQLHLTRRVQSAGGAASLCLAVVDDGVGPRAAASTSGSGQGLMLHGTLLAVIGGTLNSEPRPSGGARYSIELPCG
ncbi:MAG: hypothetical protein H7Z42_06320, partial [Roseiflexaceae bacterium]|nr:hypothetical protein [Roseiflexaceae bacterium]